MIIDLNGYPYLDQRSENLHLQLRSISDITGFVEPIMINAHNTISELRAKLMTVEAAGYLEDGGLPILDEDRVLIGFIACHELQHALNRMSRRLIKTMRERDTERELLEMEAVTRCHFRRSRGSTDTEMAAVDADAEEANEVG